MKKEAQDIPKDAYLIIIGAMKCGTTSLFNYLGDHPQVCQSSVKEPEYFSRYQTHKVNLSRYQDLWSFDPDLHKFALEASTGYTKYPQEQDVARRIYEFGIRPKFLYIIRNPIDRIESHINYADQRNKPWTLDASARQPIDLCKYYMQLQQFSNVFDQKQFLLIDFDDLKNSPIEMMRRIYEFTGLDDKWFPNEIVARNKTSLQPLVLRRIRRSKLAYAGRLVPRSLRLRITKKLEGAFPERAKRCLSEAEKQQIRHLLRDDMLDLQDQYNFDVSKWGFERKT